MLKQYSGSQHSPEEIEEKISFFAEDLDFEPAAPQKLKSWIFEIISRNTCKLENISFIFCSDNYLHQLNVQYLGHDDLTDVITFPYQPPPKIEGDIFISVDRVKDNAHTFETTFEEELHRVMIHGVPHLCGLGDKTPQEKSLMRSKEDESLALLK